MDNYPSAEEMPYEESPLQQIDALRARIAELEAEVERRARENVEVQDRLYAGAKAARQVVDLITREQEPLKRRIAELEAALEENAAHQLNLEGRLKARIEELERQNARMAKMMNDDLQTMARLNNRNIALGKETERLRGVARSLAAENSELEIEISELELRLAAKETP